MPCAHLFSDPRRSCPHAVPAGAEFCLWHNRVLRKDQDYVTELFLAADVQGGGCFAGAHLAGLHLRHADLRGRDFAGADLRDAILDGSDLSGADLTGACLRRCSLRRVKLTGARLGRADLAGAALNEADLREAVLVEAIIAGTALQGADLRGADLQGARIADFHWNRLTRFAGVRGLESPTGGEDDATRPFPSPVALGAQDLDSGARHAAHGDPGLARTHTFSALQIPPVMEVATPSGAPRLRGRMRDWLLPGLIGACACGSAWGVWAMIRRPAPSAGQVQVVQVADPALVERIADLDRQHQAALAAASEAQGQLAAQRETVSRARAEAEILHARMREVSHDLAALQDADNRAALLSLRLKEVEGLNRDLVRQSARQDQVSRILADGLDRHQADNLRLAGELKTARTRADAAEAGQAEALALRQENAGLRQERDQLQQLFQTAQSELVAAKRDIQRYLGRISATRLQDALGDDGAAGGMIALKPGSPVALGGEYLVTLSADSQPGKERSQAAMRVRLVVQRPAATANPDCTVVLYDEQKQPLRRLSYSFPHVDAGAPFVSAEALVSCDRSPAFARVILLPGDSTTASR